MATALPVFAAARVGVQPSLPRRVEEEEWLACEERR